MGGGVLPIRSWGSRKIRVSVGNVNVVDRQLETSNERVVVDLTVGDRYETDAGGERALSKKLSIKPGQVVRIRTNEKIQSPADVFGLVVSKASMAGDGLFVSNIKIDPLFRGQLRIAVFNGSHERIILQRGQQFASIYFASLDADPLDAEIDREASATKALATARFRDIAIAAIPYLGTIVVSVLTAVITTVVQGK